MMRQDFGFRAYGATLIACMAGLLVCHAAGPKSVEAQFEEKYQAWVEYTKTHDQFSSMAGYNNALLDIVQLGVPAVPFLIDRMERSEFALDFQLKYAVYLITRRTITKEECPGVRDAKSRAQAYVEWWRRGRHRTPELFARYYAEWRALKKEGKDELAEKKLKSIRALGFDALPLIMEKIEAGDNGLIPAVAAISTPVKGVPELKRAALSESASPEMCLAWWGENKALYALDAVKPETSDEAGGSTPE